ncbi:MAG: CpsD/CapB family tyrosine-protein kinase [Anaerovorax sp.]
MKEKNFVFDSSFVLTEGSPFQIKEAYKALRTNILFSLSIDTCKKILVTSAQPSDGKSINCVNLAISFAQTGARVLILDGDLRRPNVARILNTHGGDGISNVLVNLAKLEDVIQHTQYQGLDVIFSGDIPPNPAELIGTQKMAEILEELSGRYDYLFIDAPPVNAVTDASILSKYVDGVVLVVRQNYTEKKNVEEAIKQLTFAGAKLLGFVFNAVDQNEKKYGRYSRYAKSYHNDYGDYSQRG